MDLNIIDRILISIANDERIKELTRVKMSDLTRNKILSLSTAIFFILDMKTTTLQSRLNEIFRRLIGGSPVTQQAISKYRSKFNHIPFLTMHEALAKERYSNTDDMLKWNGYFLLSIDGSHAQLPRGCGLENVFGTKGSKDYPTAGISTLFDVKNGWILDATITHADMNERLEALEHMKYLLTNYPEIASHSIAMLDAGYPSKEMFDEIDKLGIKFVMKYPIKSLKVVNEAALGDSIVTIDSGQKIRVIKFISEKTDKLVVIVTNLFDFSTEDMINLYKERWEIETMYKKLKRTISLEKFSGKKENTIRQDFWATIVIYNIAVAYQKEANIVIEKRHNGKKNKYKYQARFTDLVVTLRDRLVIATLCLSPPGREKEIKEIVNVIAKSVSPIRPNRTAIRKNKRFYNVNHNIKSCL